MTGEDTVVIALAVRAPEHCRKFISLASPDYREAIGC